MLKTKLIFLDFDGILHSPHEGAFTRAHLFAYTLADFDPEEKIGIVFYSDYLHKVSADDLLHQFPSFFSSRLMGSLKPSLIQPGSAEKDIMKWMLEHQFQGDWMAIHTRRDLFSNQRKLFWVDPETALDEFILLGLNFKIRQLAGGS